MLYRAQVRLPDRDVAALAAAALAATALAVAALSAAAEPLSAAAVHKRQRLLRLRRQRGDWAHVHLHGVGRSAHHYTTFGGLVHDFYGKGLYEHARFAIAPCGCEVVIQTLLATLGRASAIAAIAVRVGDTTFEITGGGEVTIRQLGGSSSSRSLRDGGPDHAHFCNGGCMCSSARIAHLGGGFTCRAVLVTSWSSRGCIDAPGASTTTRGSVSRGA